LAARPLDQPPDQTDQETQNRVTAPRIDDDTPRSRSAQPLDQPDRKNPIAQRTWPAGSFFREIRTPIGARNSSRKAARPLWKAKVEERTLARERRYDWTLDHAATRSVRQRTSPGVM
jgi:hypothetical protein